MWDLVTKQVLIWIYKYGIGRLVGRKVTIFSRNTYSLLKRNSAGWHIVLGNFALTASLFKSVLFNEGQFIFKSCKSEDVCSHADLLNPFEFRTSISISMTFLLLRIIPLPVEWPIAVLIFDLTDEVMVAKQFTWLSVGLA